MTEFAAYILSFRKEDPESGFFSPIHYAGRLLQQLAVDSFSRIEEMQLEYLRTPKMQKRLRADSYKSLREHMTSRAEHEGVNPGKVVVLPSGFVNSPRYFTQKFQDAMAVSRKVGSPDLFITMTCNPKWKEITDSLLPGQEPSDRPDLVVKVFKLKLDELLKDLFERKIFGEVGGYTWTIEYQKRGLPHVHILLILKHARDKPRTPAQIDRIISAEIPDPVREPELYNTICRNNIHGPCGKANLKLMCMNNPKCNGQCCKAFPKSFCTETKTDVDGYPEYRRRPNQHVIPSLGIHRNVNSTWVVPYSPFLSKKFDCHINVEVSTSLKAIKYVYKYVYKGGDKAEIRLVKQYGNEEVENNFVMNIDQIKEYMDSRYLSSQEAMWRVFGYPTNSLSHHIERLPVHLPDQQEVVFEEGFHASVASSGPPTTRLTAYFLLNEGDGYDQEERDLARNTLYHDIPQHFSWNNSKTKWVQRKKKLPEKVSWNYLNSSKPIIGRMHLCTPKDMERYSLRMLLLKVKGAQSYNDLLMDSNSNPCPTFQEAAMSRGYLNDDNEWHHCLQEAAETEMPHKLRSLFATILTNCEPKDPLALWNAHHTNFYRYNPQNPITVQELIFRAYHQIEVIIQKHNGSHTLADTYKIPVPPGNFPIPHTGLNDIDRQQQATLGAEMYNTLNDVQRGAFDSIMDSVHNNLGKQFFIDGPGGTGKSFTYKALISTMLGEDRKVCRVASTGIAATLIGGVTAHKRFGIPIKLDHDSVSLISNQSKEADQLRDVELIIWDEATFPQAYP